MAAPKNRKKTMPESVEESSEINVQTKTSDSDPSQNTISKGKGKDTKKEIAVIGDEDTVIAFGLTGIRTAVTIDDNTDNNELINSIKQLIETPEIGFILITQPVAERIRQDFERMKQEKPLYPIFIELPDKQGELEDREDPIKILIRRAIGMDVVNK